MPGKSYNIGGGCQLTNRAIVEMLLNILSQKLEVPLESLTSLISYVEDRPGHDFRYAIDYSYINQEFGWQPKASFASALEQTVDWYLEQSKVRCV